MLKVVIIDDVETIVEGLKTIVKWQNYGCEVVGTASDGLQGSSLIRKARPDIVITDIKMPNMDGLNMLAGLKSEFPDMQVTVLTGFRDFEYAQQAINLGVARFLLKPSKMVEIVEAIEFMSSKAQAIKQLSEDSGSDPEDVVVEDTQNEASVFIVRNAINYINEHYFEKLTLGDVAEKNYVSVWHLSKLINKHTGKGFNDILNNVRIENAKVMLANPEYKIYEIAERVGISDVTYFSKLFKKFTGISPNQYRNSSPEVLNK